MIELVIAIPLLFWAILLDLVQIVCTIFGIEGVDSLISILGFLTIGLYLLITTFSISQTPQKTKEEAKKIMEQVGKLSRRLGIGILGEVIPVISSLLPYWSLLMVGRILDIIKGG